jgi:hypothetical protein
MMHFTYGYELWIIITSRRIPPSVGVWHLQGRKYCKLTCRMSDSLEVVGSSDSDFDKWKDDKKSTLGYIFMLPGGPITWMSHKQQLTTTSIMMAQYIAVYNATCHGMLLKNLIAGLKIFIPFLDHWSFTLITQLSLISRTVTVRLELVISRYKVLIHSWTSCDIRPFTEPETRPDLETWIYLDILVTKKGYLISRL